MTAFEKKSLEEIEACARQVGEELQKRYDERILSKGGFQCSVCARIFPKVRESTYFPGVCYEDGWRVHLQEVRSVFEDIERNHSPVEITHIGFVRRRQNEVRKLLVGDKTGPIELEHLGGTDHAAVVDFLILKIGERYVEVGVHLPDDFSSDMDDPKITLQLHGTKSPEKREDYFVWPEGEGWSLK